MSKSVSVEPHVRVGEQTPRLQQVPAYSSSAVDEAVDVMALTGQTCDPWQRHVLEGALGERADGRWSAFEVCLLVPRQNGKNFILEARELAGLLFFGEREIVHSAHRLDTARDAFRKFEYRVRSTPVLIEQVLGYRPGQDPWDHRIPGIRTSAGEMSIQMANGNKITWKTRVDNAGRGLTGDLVVLDEAFSLTPETVASMMPTMAARSVEGNPQIWYTSSAGMAQSTELARLRERGQDPSEDRLAFFEWSAPDETETDDVDAWYQANPALGIRISEDYVRDTEYHMLPDEQFRRERLGIWAPIGGVSAITPGAWKKCLDAESMTGGQVIFGVDISPARDVATISVASLRDDGRIHVEVVDRRLGASWLGERLKELSQRWRPGFTVLQAGVAAGALIGELRHSGVRVKVMGAKDYFQACGRFFDAVQDARIAHTGQQELAEATGGCRFKYVGDTLFKWARLSPAVDITPLVSATLAMWGVEQLGQPTTGAKGWKVVAL